MDFTLSSDIRPPEAVVTVAGELDVFTSPQLRDRIQDAVDAGCLHVLLDLAGVSFADAAALRVLSQFHRQLAKDGGALQLVAWSPQVLRLCQLAGIDRAFQLTDATPA